MMLYLAAAVFCLGLFTVPSEAGLFRHKSHKPKKVKAAKYGVSQRNQRKRTEKAFDRQMKNREKAISKHNRKIPKVRVTGG